MRLLAVDSSAKTASIAVYENNGLLAEFYVNNGLTHSQTLMPMIHACLDSIALTPASIDAYAVSIGPGSFTGVRIGVASIKGLASGLNKPCYGVSTLEALAHGVKANEGILCCMMDARCNQVYAAVFHVSQGNVLRILEDVALSISDFVDRVIAFEPEVPVFLAGDAAAMYADTFIRAGFAVSIVAEPQCFPRAYGVAQAILSAKEPPTPVSAEQLSPVYLRAPQAERELKRKRGE